MQELATKKLELIAERAWESMHASSDPDTYRYWHYDWQGRPNKWRPFKELTFLEQVCLVALAGIVVQGQPWPYPSDLIDGDLEIDLRSYRQLHTALILATEDLSEGTTENAA